MEDAMPKEVHNALTAARVRQEKKPGRYADGHGLYLHVNDTGARWWLWRGMVHGKRCEIGMGPARLVSLAEARDTARTWRRIARDGGNPKLERDKNKRELFTFEAAARQVWADQVEGHGKSAKYRVQWINCLRTYAFPQIGTKPVREIDQSDLLRVLAPIWTDKPVTAAIVRQRMRTVFSWARTAGHREGDNPVDGVGGGLPKQRRKVEHLAALPFSDMPDFMRRLGVADGIAEMALRFLILTAARSGEVRAMTWGEVDLENKVWVIPRERMKSDAAHRVPLSEPAIEILRAARGLDPEKVFPGQRRGRPMHDMTIAAPLKRMGVPGTVHGFRRTFRDWAAERTNTPREIAEMCLAHEVGGAVERAYRRSDLFAKRNELMGAWARWCCPRSADVIEIGGKA
jgi:integrase